MNSIDTFLARCNTLMGGQSPKDILRQAHRLLEDPVHWTRGARARDDNGRTVRPEDPNAVRWCLEGAVALACNDFGILPPYFMVLLDQTAEEDFGHMSGASLFNEHYGHEAVLILLKCAMLRVTE